MKLLVVVLMIGATITSKGQEFVQTDGRNLVYKGEVYRFVGVNLWYAMHLASRITGDRLRLLGELDHLQALGMTNLRIMASSEGPADQPWRVKPALMEEPGIYHEHLLEGLDFVLKACAERDIKIVLCLGNFWPWSGGMAQYEMWTTGKSIPYPPPEPDGSWLSYMLYTSRFYKNPEALSLYQDHVRKVVTRTNSLTGIKYRQDPTIMAWQLANEPRAMARGRQYRQWIKSTAKLIKSIDQNHLVSIGSEGRTSTRFSGNRFKRDHSFDNIDYLTAHVWVQNWGWYDPQKESDLEHGTHRAMAYVKEHAEAAAELNKPFVLEEFGMARDLGSYAPTSPTKSRDQYFNDMLSFCSELCTKGNLAGANIWGWSGAIPPRPASHWIEGDPLIGDPPHEAQGWYSIYQTDSTTLGILAHWAATIATLR